jgi:hypothetical protein
LWYSGKKGWRVGRNPPFKICERVVLNSKRIALLLSLDDSMGIVILKLFPILSLRFSACALFGVVYEHFAATIAAVGPAYFHRNAIKVFTAAFRTAENFRFFC